MQRTSAASSPAEYLPDLPCACATLRRAARVVSQLYAEEFEGLLEGPQFSLLAILNRRPGVNQAALGQILVLDKTTLSRNLGLLKRKGWIAPAITGDKRERGFVLTRSGLLLLKRARPAWERAQQRLRDGLGEAEWKRLFGVVNTVTKTASQMQNEAAVLTTPASKKVLRKKGVPTSQ